MRTVAGRNRRRRHSVAPPSALYTHVVTQLTKWVLAHRKLVVGFWIVLTLVGIATSGAATKAMDQKFSVPGREGWEANVEIAKLYHGTGGNAAPLVPVVTLPEGSAVRDPAVREQLQGVEQKLANALPGARVAGYGSTGDAAFVSKDGRTTFIIAFPTPDPDQPFGDNPKAEKKARAALDGVTTRRRTGPPDRLRRAQRAERRLRRPGRPARGAAGRLRRADRARLRVRFAVRLRAADDGDPGDHDLLPGRLRPDADHRRLADRAVPDRARRPRCRDRLLAADRRCAGARSARTGWRATRRSCARWRPPAARSSSPARRSRSACWP